MNKFSHIKVLIIYFNVIVFHVTVYKFITKKSNKTAQNRSLVNAFDSDEKGDQELGRVHFKSCSLYIHISLVYTYK